MCFRYNIKLLGHFHNTHLASPSLVDPGCPCGLIKPTGSHTCAAAQLEFGQCQAPRPIDSSCMSYRTAVVCYSWSEKAASVLACNDVLHLSLYSWMAVASCPVALQYVQIIVRQLLGVFFNESIISQKRHTVTWMEPLVLHLIHPDALLSQEEDFEDMIESAETMESQCGHLFDKVIVNGDIAVAFRELRADLERVEQAEVRWIPAEWICSSPTKVRRSCGHLGGWIWNWKLKEMSKGQKNLNCIRIFVSFWTFFHL